MQKTWLYFLMALLAANVAEAATIHGTIYDLSLKKISNARVEIDTSPKQFMIAQNGSYSFNVPYGHYTIRAELFQRTSLVASADENITIRQDGSYVLDLILFPDVEEGIEDIDVDVGGDILDAKNGKNNYSSLAIIALIFLAMVGFGLFFAVKNKGNASNQKIGEKKTDDKGTIEIKKPDDLSQIIRIIKQEGGRTTQKEVRKHIPLSEAKISLMIAELEHKGVIEKIKKGRGNIIILKEK